MCLAPVCNIVAEKKKLRTLGLILTRVHYVKFVLNFIRSTLRFFSQNVSTLFSRDPTIFSISGIHLTMYYTWKSFTSTNLCSMVDKKA